MDRGASQGDAFGSYQAAATQARSRHAWACAADGSAIKGACDEWYIDDGQLVIRPLLLDAWLRAFDNAIAAYGATRGTIAQGNAKSSCRLYCPAGKEHTIQGWCTDYVKTTMQVLHDDDQTTALGAPFGGDDALNDAVDAVLRKIQDKRSALLKVDHAATELVLTRLCADVSTFVYHMRINGDRIPEDTLRKHDASLRASLDVIIGGGVTDEAWEQATLGVASSGLGLREAASVALPAFVASRIASRPHVAAMAQHLQIAELSTVADVMRVYDERTTQALVRLVGMLDPGTAGQLVDDLDQCADSAAERWAALFDSSATDDGGPDLIGATRRPRRPGAGVSLLPDDEDEDDDHPDASSGSTSLHIQKLVMRYIDGRRIAEARKSMDDRSDIPGLRRLDDLQHKDQDHSWLWALSKHRGPTLTCCDYVEA
eukprot:9200366-Karenia_brevis.AAC.1